MILSIRNILRLCRRQNAPKIRYYSSENEVKNEKNWDKKDFKTLYTENKDKITFSSYIDHEKLEFGHFKYYLKIKKQNTQTERKNYADRHLSPLPVSLKFLLDKEQLLKEDSTTEVHEPEQAFQLPYAQLTKVQSDKYNSHFASPNNIKDNAQVNTDKWMTNYEHFDDSILSDEGDEVSEWGQKYGTPDPNEKISRVPCGGCGALLHCKDPAIPGYLPSEIIKNRSDDELKTIECQRCHFLKEYNIALDVSVQSEEYENLLQSIRHIKSLVLLMVDLLDFPCSIWPGIVDIIGKERPIIIVANKVDLLPGDSVGYLKRIKESFITEMNKTKLADANVKHVALISAKTGYGVEDLISAMFKIWLGRGHVFLVGCTNVGKSSLFNALLQSDYCKVQAVDIVKRATVSRWPGTTLHLLKFPINRPSTWKIYHRMQRLKSERKILKEEKDIREAQLTRTKFRIPPALIGHIGRTFSDPQIEKVFEETQGKHQRMMVLDERNSIFANSNWFYDTPGVVHPEQVLALLTTEELLLTLPQSIIRPQTYYLGQGSTLFVGGLARIDNVYCDSPCRFTVFCSDSLPITVTKTEDANEVYDKFLGTELLAVPTGGAERLKNWPGINKFKNLLEFSGVGPKCCCGDIVLSSVAWIAVTAKYETVCKVAAWTPEARGIYKRYPSVLPYCINLKGKRIRDTPAYMIGKVYDGDK